MKALQKTAPGPGNVAVVEVPEPVPGPGQVRLRVARAGICGTDLHILHGQFAKVRPPVTLGHEVAGTVDTVGPGVTAWRPGDRVTAESEASTCGQCDWCRSGRANLCPQRLALGYGVHGGFAAALVVRQTALHRLPEAVSFSAGALSEPLTVAVHAVHERSRLGADDWALVTGPGPIGLLVLQVAQAAGARVIVSGTARDAERLALAERLGARAALHPGTGDLAARVESLTEGRGVAVAFECAGVGPALEDCLTHVRRGGQVIQVGLCGRAVTVDVDRVAMKEIDYLGAFVHTRATWRQAVDLMATGAIDLEALVSGEFALDRWAEAFELSAAGTGVKYLLCPQPAQ